MNKTDNNNRRRFLRRFGALGGALSGLMTTLVPEARAQAKPSAGSSTAVPMPPAPPLPAADENRLYSAALNDSDVYLLTAFLGAQARLDPPTRSASIQLDGGNTLQAVMLPLVAYGATAPTAYIFYGAATVVAGGLATPMQIKAMISSTGAVMLAGGGRIAPSPRTDWNNAFWASMFPEQFVDSLSQSSPAPATLTRVSGSLWNRAFLRKTMMADNSARGLCRRNCARQALICSIAATTALSTGIFVGIWCITCMSLAIGVTVGTGGAAAPTIVACSTACAISQAAIVAATIALAICTTVFASCMSDCNLIPPDRPI